MMSGLYEGTAYGDKVFYGLRLDATTGQLLFDIVDDDTPIALPQDGVINPNDYKALFWSSDAVRLRWGTNGHIQMVFL